MVTHSPSHSSAGPPVHHLPSISGRQPCSFFEIRLGSDVLVAWERESQGPVLSGTVVLCLQSSLRIEDVHLQLMGVRGYSAVDPRLLVQKDRFVEHRWKPFAGAAGQTVTLPPGNYEWPFDFTFPHNAVESVQGIPEMSVTYALKATVSRGKRAHDLHAYKQLRIIRVVDPDSLELIQPVGVEDIWANKVEYSIAIPHKTVGFGSSIPIRMQFTPLLKGLELKSVTAKMVEIREGHIPYALHPGSRKYRTERETPPWTITVTREEFWQDVIQESDQEGWVINKLFNLPKQLSECVQDLSLKHVKVRHKISLSIKLLNPDGHVSELLATLPISIVFYPSMIFDKKGCLVDPSTSIAYGGASEDTVLPAYEDHLQDMLYEAPEGDLASDGSLGFAMHSGTSSDSDSRSGHSTDLAHRSEFDPANISFRDADSGDDGPSTQNREYEEDGSAFRDLERVPSYQTAIRTPFRPHAMGYDLGLPNYQTSVNSRRD